MLGPKICMPCDKVFEHDAAGRCWRCPACHREDSQYHLFTAPTTIDPEGEIAKIIRELKGVERPETSVNNHSITYNTTD